MSLILGGGGGARPGLPHRALSIKISFTLVKEPMCESILVVIKHDTWF